VLSLRWMGPHARPIAGDVLPLLEGYATADCAQRTCNRLANRLPLDQRPSLLRAQRLSALSTLRPLDSGRARSSLGASLLQAAFPVHRSRLLGECRDPLTRRTEDRWLVPGYAGPW